jgi:hypothetical protein
MKKNLNTTIGDPLSILNCNGYKPLSELNYCTENGIEYFIGYKENKALVVAIIFNEDIYFITKPELREMSLTAKIKGINDVTFLTNYGIELHSRFEKPETIGFNRIIKAH